MTVPDVAYWTARLTSILSILMIAASVLMTGYGVTSERFNDIAGKCKDLLAISREARNVFVGFLAILLFTVAPKVKVGGMSVTKAITGLMTTYCQAMVVVLFATFVCSAIGVFKGSLTASAKEHIGAMRLSALVFAVIGIAVTYVTSFA